MDVLNIEVILKQKCSENKETIIEVCTEYIRTNQISLGTTIKATNTLPNYIDSINVEEPQDDHGNDLSKYKIQWYVYKLDHFGGQVESMQGSGDECISLATNWVLPSAEFDRLWDNLIYTNDIKRNLLKYIETTMLFSDKGVDCNIVCSNRVVLLHGPPGTGKTSLCKALAQKLSIRLQNRYHSAQLVEINSHSLFSKWFSESGKLVNKMFSNIRDTIDNPRILVIVLIDEVESLAHARKQCMSGSEPSDSIRVVNTLLTQIDQLKRYPNVLILTTSNMTGIIDVAFVDRADIKQFIGLPSRLAIYKIYYGCVQELMRTELVERDVLLPFKAFSKETGYIACHNSQKLMSISETSCGLSGRALRKVPFLAHALFLNKNCVTLSEFLSALESAVDHIKKEKEHFDVEEDK